jgi:hypothetical protein
MLGGSPEDQERFGREEVSRNVVAQVGKLFLLLDHFQIPRASYLRWFHLAFHLARQHVPGMKIVSGPNPRRGPKGKWRETQLDSELIVAVTAVKLARRRGAADAIRILRKREPNVWGRFDEGSLRTRYYEALRPMKPYRRGSLIESLAAFYDKTDAYTGMTTAARVRVSLNPREMVHIDSTDNETLNLQCGDYAKTLKIVDPKTFIAAEAAQ